jgi:hypothetical protein
MFATEFVDEIKTHMFNNVFSRKYHLRDNVKNVVEPDRPQMTVKYGANALHAA